MIRLFKFHIQKLESMSPSYKNSYDFYIERCVTLDDLQNNSLIFVKKPVKDDLLAKLENLSQCLILLLPSDDAELYDKIKSENMVIETPSPRLTFARVFKFILDNSTKKIGAPFQPKEGFQRGNNVVIGNGTTIDENVRVGDNVVIGENVIIGKNCLIMSGVVINNNVTIGENSIIRENSVIGSWGYGFEKDENGIWTRLPHVGGVTIGHDVEVGALTTVVSGTFKPTLIGDYTKIDDHVHISHNCRIGINCVIVAFSAIAGSVTIGNNCWIGLNCSIIQSTKIGNDCTVGMGAVVKKNISDGVTVSDNPAQTLEELALKRKIYQKLKKNFLSGKEEILK